MFSCVHLPCYIQKSQTVANYIESADHLTEIQKTALKNGEPFIGMTVEEADILLCLKTSYITLDNGLLYGVYNESSIGEYHVYFSGAPLRVTFWSVFEFKDIKLPDVEDLRPDSGIPSLNF